MYTEYGNIYIRISLEKSIIKIIKVVIDEKRGEKVPLSLFEKNHKPYF